ncbi:uncharacterized protein LOC143247153 [Tachypleus tridentatus]|uniref:uncharacterized protein LOC143247153 n=1 Tax=Tachypleus tridentatus TaxID=6853 RepID=UPI003FD18D4E
MGRARVTVLVLLLCIEELLSDSKTRSTVQHLPGGENYAHRLNDVSNYGLLPSSSNNYPSYHEEYHYTQPYQEYHYYKPYEEHYRYHLPYQEHHYYIPYREYYHYDKPYRYSYHNVHGHGYEQGPYGYRQWHY